MNNTLRQTSAKEHVITTLSRAFMIFSPFILLLIVSMIIRHNAFDSFPVWSDEIDYWRALLSWDAVGYHKGYSGLFEILPAAGTLGVRGFTPILLYGWFVKLFGLTYSTIMTCNAVWISIAALVFCLLHKPKPAVSLFFGAFIIAYVPIVLYCVTSMTELFNYALMLFYITFLYSYHHTRSPWMLLLSCLVSVIGCMYRLPYFLLFIPIVLAFSNYKWGLKMILSFLAAMLIAFGSCFVAAVFTAPNIAGFPYQLTQAPSLDILLQMLLGHTKSNLIDYFVKPCTTMETAFRILYFAVMGLCLLGTFIQLEKTPRAYKPRLAFSREMLWCFLFLFAAFSFVVIFFETNDWRDYRILAPFLWMVIGYRIVRQRFVIPSVALLLSLGALAVLLTIEPVGAYNDATRFEREALNENITAAAASITYDPNAADPLTNTVRIDLPSLQAAEELHPGLGLQYGWCTTETTGKSNWIFTDVLKCVVNGYEPVTSLPNAKVYKLIESYEVLTNE